jgi:hypothetical protein
MVVPYIPEQFIGGELKVKAGLKRVSCGRPPRPAERSALTARQIDGRDNLRTALTLMGASYSALNQTDQARRAFEEAMVIIESLRTNITGQEARATYLASVREPYDLYIDLLMRLHRQSPLARHDHAR